MLKVARKNEQAIRMAQKGEHSRHQPQGDISTLLVFANKDFQKSNEHLVKENQENRDEFKKTMREITEKLCEKYPQISTYKGVFNGKPHLKGTRFTVADVLSAICVENSIENIIEEYGNRYTDEQLKEAIEYARDFLLSAYSLP